MAQDDVTLNIGANTDAAEKAFKNLEKSVLETGKDIQKVAKKSAGAWSTFKGVLGAQAVVGGLKAISRAAIGVGKSFIDAAAGIETINTELTTVTGSAEEAEKLLRELTDFAATTPFQLEGIARASKQLIAFGFETETVRDRLQQIGDVAAGSGAQLSDVSLIYGQVAAAGKLTGERLLQFQERAIPIGPAIAKTMGIAEEAVKDTVSKGKVDLATFEKAFKSLSQEGGIFFESMIDKSQTFDGVMSTLSDNISLLSAEMGQELLPAIKEVAKSLITFIQNNKKEIVNFFKTVLQASAFTIKSIAKIGTAADKVSKALGFDEGHRRLKANQELIDRYREKIKDLNKTIEGGTGWFTDQGDIDKATKSLETYNKLLLEARERNAELVKQGATLNIGDDLSKGMDAFIDRLEESKNVITGIKNKAKEPGGIQTQSFWDGMVENFSEAQSTMAKRAAANWKTALLKIGKSLGSALTSGSTATRSNLDEIEKIEKKMAIAKAHNELAEYDKLVDEKIQAEKELAKVQQEEAGKFFSSTAGALADVFIPGAGAFVETLLSLAQDPEAFRAFIDGFVSALPEIINVIVDNIPFIIETIIAHLPEIIQALAVGMVKVAAALARAVLAAVKEGFDELLQAIGNMVGNVINAGGEFLRSIGKSAQLFINDLLGFVPRLIETIGNGIADAIKDALPEFSVGGGGGVLGSIGEGVSGAVKGVGKIFGFADGIASVPQGFPNDNFPARLTSGEEVVSVDDKASIKRELSLLAQTVASSQGGSQTINVQLTLDGNVLAEQILQLDRDNQRLTA